MPKSTLSEKDREGFTAALGTTPQGKYQVSDPQGNPIEDPEAAQEAEAPQAEMAPAAAGEREQAAAETQPEVAETEEGGEESEGGPQSDRDFLDQLVAAERERESSAAPETPAADPRVSQLEQRLKAVTDLLGERLSGAEARIAGRPETQPGAPDLSSVDWTSDGILQALQDAGLDDDTARAVAQNVLRPLATTISEEVIKPQLAALTGRLDEGQNQNRRQLALALANRNLESGLRYAQSLKGTMAEAVAQQFIDAAAAIPADKRKDPAATKAAYTRSALGRKLLRSPESLLSEERLWGAILEVTGQAEVQRRRGSTAETVLSGTKEEMTAALGRAHRVKPSETKGDERATPEEAIRAEMLEAAGRERGRVGKAWFAA